jgi:hypothetical protein
MTPSPKSLRSQIENGQHACGGERVMLPTATVMSMLDELDRLQGLLNTPRTDEFFESVRVEAAHQVERWGSEHDAGKTPQDWFWLLGYLAGKALAKPEKRLHHIVSSAAALLNWFRAETSESTAMRPGIIPPSELKVGQ